MVEVELKFQLPESKLFSSIWKSIKHSIFTCILRYTKPSTRKKWYGPTFENDLWVQTFKAAGQSHLQKKKFF